MLVVLLVAFFVVDVWLVERFGVDFAVVAPRFALDLVTDFAGILLAARGAIVVDLVVAALRPGDGSVAIANMRGAGFLAGVEART